MRILAFALAFLLLAGCAGPVERPDLSAANETRLVPESPGYPGVTVRGTLDGTAEGLTIAALARNDGNRTYDVETNCGSPWTEELRRGDTRIELREPTARCLAFSLKAFGPGESSTFNASWDGTIWDPESERQEAAPPGEYTWIVRFAMYKQETAKRFDLEFNVTVSKPT